MTRPALVCRTRQATDFSSQIWIAENRRLESGLVGGPSPCTQRSIDIKTLCPSENIPKQ